NCGGASHSEGAHISDPERSAEYPLNRRARIRDRLVNRNIIIPDTDAAGRSKSLEKLHIFPTGEVVRHVKQRFAEIAPRFRAHKRIVRRNMVDLSARF